MSSQPSPCNAFERLDPRLQRWIWDQGWDALRPFQEEAIHAVLDGEDDLILSASTASGKTEAVFLPLMTHLSGGLRILYVSPLKALINDQADRLSDLGSRVDVPIHRWHGDVQSQRKKRLLANPQGILLMTPESLEALFVLRGPELSTFFKDLQTVVIDELHVFLGTERGRQLQSQLHRLDRRLDRRVRRIALSATLGDPEAARSFLHAQARLISNTDRGRQVQLQVRYYPDKSGIVEHLYRTLRDSDNMIFCNRRSDVEQYTEALRKLETTPTFFPHHGSLAPALREEVEARLRSGQMTTVVCTTTLELGIDFGQVTSVAQIDPPPSVAALFQRLGRSGRRGAPSAVRVYVQDEAELRPMLVQAVAMVSLLLERWMEPNDVAAWHLSTLVQQILSLIAERHGVSAKVAYDVLCRTGPFHRIEPPTFALVLRSLGQNGLIDQSPDGSLGLAEGGAREVGHYSFYAAFASSEEYSVHHQDRTLGTLPVAEPLQAGMVFLFAGRSWKVVDVDPRRRVVSVEAAPGGTVPSFVGTGIPVHDTVRRRMQAVYEDTSVPAFLNDSGRTALQQARQAYHQVEGPVVAVDGDVLLFPWRGDRVLHTLRLQLSETFPSVVRDKAWLRIRDADPEEVSGVVLRLASRGPASGLELASGVRNLWAEKWDRTLPQELLWTEYAARRLDPVGAWEVLCHLRDSRRLPHRS